MLESIGVLLILLPVCSLAPGFYFVRKLRWNPLERFCASIGLSLFLIYGATFLIYVLKVSGQWHWAIAAACVLGGLLSIHDLLRLLSCHQVRRALLGFVFLLLWAVLLLSLVRHYSGGNWNIDWFEQFKRTRFFLERLPTHTLILPGDPLPARPPLMNLLGAYFLFLTQSGERFELFQVVFLFLNLLVFFPCCLIARALTKRAPKRMVLLVAVFALSPLFVQNLTYSWTKLLTVFYVMLGIWLYLAGWRKRDSIRIVAGFVSLAAGVLVHYSAGPFMVFLALHYMVLVLRKFKDRWRELLAVCPVQHSSVEYVVRLVDSDLWPKNDLQFEYCHHANHGVCRQQFGKDQTQHYRHLATAPFSGCFL